MINKPKSKSAPPPQKLTLSEAKEKIVALSEQIEKYEDTAFCIMCRTHKNRDEKFYFNTDPMCGGASCTPICRECARRIALRVNARGEEQEPTKESVQLALRYLNKPFLNSVWNASIQESENEITGKTKNNPWTAYMKNIQMRQYVGLTYLDSDMFKNATLYHTEEQDKKIAEEHMDQDTYLSFQKNRRDVVRLLGYDPFENEDEIDQPFLYSQLLGLLDASEDANDDMMRTASAISIVRGFLQQSKIDDTIAKLMSDFRNIEKNSATIKSLQDSKAKITSVITNLAQDSCISLKYSKNASKGDNTWTGKVKKIKELSLREGEVNGFDMATCKAMRQVQEISDASMLKQLQLDESDWSDMVAEMRVANSALRKECDQYKEINRILLRENLDLKDLIEENKIEISSAIVNLRELYSPFSAEDIEEEDDESDNSTESDGTSV